MFFLQINGDVEKVTTNGDAKKEEVVEEETKAEPEAEEPAKESDETVEEAAGKYLYCILYLQQCLAFFLF